MYINVFIIDVKNRIFLTRYPNTEDHSSYINAVSVDAFRNPGGFIVTQQPLQNTVGDFWRLVVERNIMVIVSLNSVNLEDEVSVLFCDSCICFISLLVLFSVLAAYGKGKQSTSAVY